MGIFAIIYIILSHIYIPQCFTCTHTHTNTSLSLSISLIFFMLYHTFSLSLNINVWNSWFFFYCSYRAGVTMSLLYIDSVFCKHLRMRPYNRAKIFLPNNNCKSFPHDHSGISYTKRTAMNFFPSSFSTSLYCSPWSSEKLLLVKVRKGKKNNNNNTKSSLRTILHSLLFLYFLLWLLHFS